VSPRFFRERDAGLSSVQQSDRVFRCGRIQVHVAVRRRWVRVAGQLLDGSRGRPFHRQVRTERVPQDVHALVDTGDALSAADGLDHPIARDRQAVRCVISNWRDLPTTPSATLLRQCAVRWGVRRPFLGSKGQEKATSRCCRIFGHFYRLSRDRERALCYPHDGSAEGRHDATRSWRRAVPDRLLLESIRSDTNTQHRGLGGRVPRGWCLHHHARGGQRLKELERENRELKRANEILKKASAYFAQAELDRRAKERLHGSTVPLGTDHCRRP
jgi:transposase-like protein